MNTLDAAYRLGILIRKTNLGSEYYVLYNHFLSELPDSARGEFQKLLAGYSQVGFGNHFFKIIELKEILVLNKDNEFLKDEINEIINNENFKKLVKLSELMGKELEFTFEKVYSLSKELKTYGNEDISTPKIRRALTDLQRQIQLTGAPEWIALHLQDASILTEYEEIRENTPFSKRNNSLRQSLVSDKIDDRFLDKLEILMMMISNLKDIIFNAYIDNFIELNIVDIDRYKLFKSEGLKYGLLVLEDKFPEKRSFSIKLRNGNHLNYGFITSTNIKFSSIMDNKLTTTLKVYLFPENDTGYFRDNTTE